MVKKAIVKTSVTKGLIILMWYTQVNSNHSFCDDLDDFDDEKESSCSYCAPSFEKKGDDPDTREWFFSRVGSRHTPKYNLPDL